MKKTYQALIDVCPNIQLKGKNMLYTSDNGYMFSLINKDGELGIRFSEARKKELMEALNTTEFKSHGATMKGYIKIPDMLLKDLEKLSKFLKESQAYVMSLEPK